MKLFDGGRAPNPRRVRIFLMEKGVCVPIEPVDIALMAHKEPSYTAINPLQRLPALVLDDGSILTESVAICRYFEGLHPDPPLFGRGILGTAQVEMWNRRVEFHLLGPVSQAFRHLHSSMKDLEVPQIPAWGECNKTKAVAFLAFLDRELQQRRFVAGDHFTIADITALVAVDFLKPAKVTMPDDLVHLQRWHAEVAARPSATA
jgi:glutathione S-transferase